MKSWLALPLLVTLFGGLTACAPDSSTDGSGGGRSSASGDSGGNSGNGGSGSGSDSTSSGFGTQASTGTLMECASETQEAELAPLTMFIAFDRSGSMDGNRWDDATAALKSFFGDPEAAGLEVAFRFFPQGDCTSPQCSIDACATPNVDVGTLTADAAPTDAHEQALVTLIDGTNPNGGTPMGAALEGAVEWSAAYLAANADHKVVVILVTDGEPNGCGDTGDVVSAASDGVPQGIVTYAVGLEGSNEGTMDDIAQAGGGQAFFIGDGDTEAQLLAALQAIRGEQLACEITIPEPTEGDFNPLLVNVSYTPGGSTSAQTIGKVQDDGSCGPGGGWYYDDATNPTTIILCPATCDVVRTDEEGRLSVVLGCETIPA